MTHETSDTTSEYHDVTKPAFEKDPWDHDYYDFVDTVDANLKLSGAVADRPATADAPDNAWYEATDEGLVYRNDPNNGWTAIGGTGTSSSKLPSVATESLEIGDTRWIEDENSPMNVGTQSGGDSFTYTLSETTNCVVLIPEAFVQVSELRVNGLTGNDYDYVTRDGTETIGATEIPIDGRMSRMVIQDIPFGATGNGNVFIETGATGSGAVIGGRFTGQQGPSGSPGSQIDQFTFFSQDGIYSFQAPVKVYRRDPQ